jgi:opacity protein-like surface antigen
MKKTLLLITLVSSSVALAEPYLGAELQYNKTGIGDKNYESVDFDGQHLDLTDDDSDTSVRLFAGYRFANQFGIEVGYVDFGAEDSYETKLSVTEEEEWDAEYDVTQLEVLGTYTYALNESLNVQFAAGLVWHDVEFSYAHELDVENGPDQTYSAYKSDDDKIGFSSKIALEYNVWEQVDVLAGVRYSNSSLADSSAIFTGIQYRF